MSFPVHFVAEVMFDIWFVTNLNAFQISWRVVIVNFLVLILIAPFYVLQNLLWVPLEIVAVIGLAVLESMILFRASQVRGLKAALLEKNGKVIEKVNLGEVLKSWDAIIQVAIPLSIALVIGTSLSLSRLPDPLKALIGLGSGLFFLVVYARYYQGRLTDAFGRVGNVLSTIFTTLIAISVLTYTIIFFLSIDYWNLSPLSGSVLASFSFAIPILLGVKYLSGRFREKLSSEDVRKVGAIFVKDYLRYIYTTIVLIVLLSDVPVVYSLFATEDVTTMLGWVLVSVWTLAAILVSVFEDVTRIRIQGGMITRDNVTVEIGLLVERLGRLHIL